MGRKILKGQIPRRNVKISQIINPFYQFSGADFSQIRSCDREGRLKHGHSEKVEDVDYSTSRTRNNEVGLKSARLQKEAKQQTDFFVSPPRHRITMSSSPAYWQAGRFVNSVYSLASKMIKWIKYLTACK